MKLYGQLWLYRVGNAEVAVDNAFSWWGWAQERWLTTPGEGVLCAELRSRLNGLDCSVTLDGEAVPHDTLFEAEWLGRKSWPAAEDWKEVSAFSVFNFAGMS